MIIGSFGSIIFQVSSEKILTFDNFKRESKANYAEHKIIGKPAKLEFLGRALETISFTAIFTTQLLPNTDLLQEVHKFRQKLWDGEACYLIFNSHAYTQNKMIIENLSEAVEIFDGKGAHQVVKIDVSLKEYTETIRNEE